MHSVVSLPMHNVSGLFSKLKPVQQAGVGQLPHASSISMPFDPWLACTISAC